MTNLIYLSKNLRSDFKDLWVLYRIIMLYNFNLKVKKNLDFKFISVNWMITLKQEGKNIFLPPKPTSNIPNIGWQVGAKYVIWVDMITYYIIMTFWLMFKNILYITAKICEFSSSTKSKWPSTFFIVVITRSLFLGELFQLWIIHYYTWGIVFVYEKFPCILYQILLSK